MIVDQHRAAAELASPSPWLGMLALNVGLDLAVSRAITAIGRLAVQLSWPVKLAVSP